ncbi:MAG: OadG family protein [Caldisericia bacterium]|nr:OadG family protein [Caldisericia bacterium]
MKVITINTLIFGAFAMTTVMLVLAFLGFIIYLFKFIFYKEKPPKKEVIEENLPQKVLEKKEEKDKKKVALIAAAINMYLSSRKGVTLAFASPKSGEGTNLWKLKGILEKRANGIKERRWRNG